MDYKIESLHACRFLVGANICFKIVMGLFRFLFLSGEMIISSSAVRSTASIAMSSMHHKRRFYHLKLSKYPVSRINILLGLKNLVSLFYFSYRTLEWLFQVLHHSYATVFLSRHKFDASVWVTCSFLED